jgi:S-(hydroxymethyl)glutathione dehydrogenase/alcohol dehydrogenase
MKTKAAILYNSKTPLVIEEIDINGPKEREVLVKLKSAGLCHSDLSIINGLLTTASFPCVLGHEGAGIVEQVGPGVSLVKPGDHVVLLGVPVCGQCYYCLRGQHNMCVNRDKVKGGTMLDGTCRLKKGKQDIHVQAGLGCYSEYTVVSQECILPIDPDFPLEIAGVFGCGILTGVGAVMNKAKVRPGSSVAIVGVGGVGLNVVQGAVLANASKIIAIDIMDNKLEFAKRLGATHFINSSTEDPVKRVMELTAGIGVDYAFEVIGKPETALTTFKLIRRGGFAVLVGVAEPNAKLTLPQIEFSFMEKSILGCFLGSGDMRIDLLTLLGLYKTGRLKADELITNRYRLEEINMGFKDLEAGKNARGAVIY